MKVASGWGPRACKGALSITLDHFGEAAELEFGRFPAGRETGRHFTALEGLDTVLALFRDQPVSWFIEASNVALYPSQLRAIRDADHDIGLHGWRHEIWQRQPPEARTSILDRSLAAFDTLGIGIRGFRPPGGGMPDDAWPELGVRGFAYCSPQGAAGATSARSTVAQYPFAWQHVDAFTMQDSPGARALRVRNGHAPEPQSPQLWRSAMLRAAGEAIDANAHYCVIFHPYLFLADPQMLGTVREVLEQVRHERDLWVVPCAELARWQALGTS